MKGKDTFASFLLRSTDTVKELVAIYVGVILLCSLGFSYFESIPYLDSVWMSFVTATSTGYGDLYPKSVGGRVIAVFLMHSVILVIAPLMVYRIIDAVDNNDFTDEEQEELKRKTDWLVSSMEKLSGDKYET